jgi:hypothetical protein
VPAITPWVDGAPRFATTGTARTYICAVERRCSICGATMPPGRVWRVIAGGEVEAIEAALAGDYAHVNRAATTEAPGHYACMLYAAAVCPYLARPQARRDAPEGMSLARGYRRGERGAVAGFERYEYRLQEAVLFRFDGLAAYHPHNDGAEHLPRLRAAVDDPLEVDIPAYLLMDEAAAEARMAAHLSGRAPVTGIPGEDRFG